MQELQNSWMLNKAIYVFYIPVMCASSPTNLPLWMFPKHKSCVTRCYMAQLKHATLRQGKLVLGEKQHRSLVEWEGKTNQKYPVAKSWMLQQSLLRQNLVILKKHRRDATAGCHFFHMLSRGKFHLCLVVLEFVLLLFIHNCTANMLSFKLEEEEKR